MSQINLEWSPKALVDLTRLYAFLAVHDIDAANDAMETIDEKSQVLTQFPRLGEKCRGNIRKLFIPFGSAGYILFYRVVGNTVKIARVWHTKEDVKL